MRSWGVLEAERSDFIRHVFETLKSMEVAKKVPQSKQIGKTGNCPYLNCPFLFSLGYETYCDNSEVIRMFLEKDNGNQNDYQ